VAKSKTPAPRRAGTANPDTDFERLLRAIGDDPEYLMAVIVIADRLAAKKTSRRRRAKSTRRY
jgi:hypothetical protein